MKILKYELRKLLTTKPFLAFLALCFAFNTLLVISNSAGYDYADYLSDFVKANGVSIDDGFISAADSENDDGYSELLQADAHGAFDYREQCDFDGYAEAYIRAFEIDGRRAELVREKFDRLRKSAYKLSESDDIMTIYCGEQTDSAHTFLFGTLFQSILMESFIAAILISILTLSQEQSARTEALVYSSKIGRRLYLHKLVAGLICSFAAYIALSLLALLTLLLFSPYAPMLSSGVESCFNHINDMIAGVRPFITYSPMSVWEYMLSGFAVGAGLVAAVSLVGYAVMLITNKSYISFALIAGADLAVLMLTGYTAGTGFFYVLTDTPVMLWLQTSLWFTDGDGAYLYPHFETRGMLISFALSAILAVCAIIICKRRDILCGE